MSAPARPVRRVASAALLALSGAALALGALPAAHAGLTETPAEPPAAYTTQSSGLAVTCQLATVNLQTGEVAALPAGASADACVSDLAVAPDGTVWGVSQTEGSPVANLVQFDPSTGAVIATTPFSGDFSDASLVGGGLAFDAAGVLYAQLVTESPGCVDGDAVCLYTVDRATAATTLVGDPGADLFFTPMSFLGADCGASLVTGVGPAEEESVGEAFGTAGDVGAQALDRRLSAYDKASGALAVGPAFAGDFSLAGLDFSRQDGVLYAIGSTTGIDSTDDAGAADVNAVLYTVDPATAALTEVAALSDPALNHFTLGIGGQCPVAPAPIVLEPTFTG